MQNLLEELKELLQTDQCFMLDGNLLILSKILMLKRFKKQRINFSDKVIKKFFDYCESQNITPENLADGLKDEFSQQKTISVNSKNDSKEKQIIINTLEDVKNEYLVIFAVDALN